MLLESVNCYTVFEQKLDIHFDQSIFSVRGKYFNYLGEDWCLGELIKQMHNAHICIKYFHCTN